MNSLDSEPSSGTNVYPNLDTEALNSVLFQHSPWFCVKTVIQDLKTSDHKEDNAQKLFINVCTHTQVPAKPNVGDNIEETTSGIVVPLILGDLRMDVDKKGNHCKVIDCVVNPESRDMVRSSSNYKGQLLATILEAIEAQVPCILSRELATPNIIYKGKQSTNPHLPRHRYIMADDPDNKTTKVTYIIDMPHLSSSAMDTAKLHIEPQKLSFATKGLSFQISFTKLPKPVDITHTTARFHRKGAQLVFIANLLP